MPTSAAAGIGRQSLKPHGLTAPKSSARPPCFSKRTHEVKTKPGYTKVQFRKWPEGDVIALFLEEPGTPDPATCSSYQHIGQHGSADPYLVRNVTRPARPHEYHALARELRRIGYKLRVVQRGSQHDYQVRRKALAKFRS